MEPLRVVVADRLRIARIDERWQERPVTETAARVVQRTRTQTQEAWPIALAALTELDSEAAGLIDALERTGDACGTALAVAWDLEEPIIIDGFTHPLPGANRTSGFGYRVHPITGQYKLHAGTDYAHAGDACDQPIRAAGDGTVTYAGEWGGYGNVIIIEHTDGLTTRYAHMEASGIVTATNRTVAAGDIIALVGDAGTSTACHLHFETYLPDGRVVDPESVIPALTVTAETV